MAKFLKKKKKKPVALIVLLVVLIILIASAILIMPQLLYRLSGDGEESLSTETVPYVQESEIAAEATAAEPPEAAQAAVQLPVQLEDGRLEINSLFQYSGLNPDCGGQQGTDIASIVLKNLSDTYLAEARVTMDLADGTQLHFLVTDLPAGASVMAFSTENQSIPMDPACINVDCEAVFDETATLSEEKVSVSVSGMAVALTNISGEDLPQIVVYCRSPLGEDYFGGVTYVYTVNDLPAGETATVDALDCILGIAEVVRIAIN